MMKANVDDAWCHTTVYDFEGFSSNAQLLQLIQYDSQQFDHNNYFGGCNYARLCSFFSFFYPFTQNILFK